MLAAIRQAIGDWGFFATALYALDRTFARLSRGKARIYFYRLEVQPVPQQPLLPAHRGRQFAIRQLDSDDPAHDMGPRPKAVRAARHKQGSVCLGAFLKDQLVGQLWLQFDSYREDEVRCLFRLEPANRVAWDYDVYVEPSLRASFLFAKLWDAGFDLLRQRGIAWTASRISAFNTGSLTSHARLGARQVGRAVYVVFGSVQLMLANQKPFIHCSVREQGAPTLTIRQPGIPVSGRRGSDSTSF